MPKINLSQYQFSLRDPYQPGHEMTELEANILNYHRADNIRKIVTRWMADAEKIAPDGVLTVSALDNLTAAILQFDRQYELSAREAPRLPAYDHQLHVIAAMEVSKMNAMDDKLRERWIEEAMRDPNNKARARRVLISHLRSIYGEAASDS